MMTLVIMLLLNVLELCTLVKHGIFPDSLKIAKVTSVHKSGDSSS